MTGHLAETFLKREWIGADGEKGKGAKHNDNLQIIIKYVLVICQHVVYMCWCIVEHAFLFYKYSLCFMLF